MNLAPELDQLRTTRASDGKEVHLLSKNPLEKYWSDSQVHEVMVERIENHEVTESNAIHNAASQKRLERVNSLSTPILKKRWSEPFEANIMTV